MKTNISSTILSLFLTVAVFAQGKTSVYAANLDISDNLDLKAVASIFGDSKDIADFEYRLNDPNIQISNLDLNNDNMVDYLRVIEMIQNNTHLVVLQAVLQEDVYQDVATIAVSRKKNRQINIQIIGDPYMYGSNYIYEPVYVVRPPLYSNFWVTNYRPYRSYYGWNRYPTFYKSWNPYAYNHYHQNIYVHINHNNYYNYSSNIYNSQANDYYRKYRNNGYEQKYPNRNFAHRTSQTNRYEYDRLQKQSGRSSQVTTGLRASTINSQNSRTSSTARSTTSSSTRPTSIANSTVRPTTSRATKSIRATSSVAKPLSSNTARPVLTTAKSAVRPVSNNSARATNSTSARPRTTETASSRSPNATTSRPAYSASQRGSTTSSRSSNVSQNRQQPSSSASARTSQPNLESRNTSSNRSFR